jgi:hypothetical protein
MHSFQDSIEKKLTSVHKEVKIFIIIYLYKKKNLELHTNYNDIKAKYDFLKKENEALKEKLNFVSHKIKKR